MTGLLTMIAMTAGAVLTVYLVSAALVWRRYRAPRTVTCPETGQPARIRIDVGHAIVTDMLDNEVDVRVAHCSRWAERGRCDQPCRPHLNSGTRSQIIIE